MIQPPPEENTAAAESPGLQFLPRQQEAPGWRMEENPKGIPGDKLANYLGTQAAAFARYGDLDVAVGNYVATNDTGFATVEIFHFPDSVNAFGAYSMHKRGPMQFLNVENEAFAAKTSIHLWRGPFYVRIIGSGGNEGAPAMMRMLNAIVARMPAAPERPAIFSFLPADNRIANSERYSANSGLGQSFLGNSFQADFQTDAGPITGLVIPAANLEAASRIIADYRALYFRNGKILDPIPDLGDENFSAEDKFLGRAVAFRIDRFVFVFNGYIDRQRIVDLAVATSEKMLEATGSASK